MQSSLRRRWLRQATSDAHASVESAAGSFASLEGYGRYLRGLHAFRLPIEQQLSTLDWPALFDGWRPQPLCPLLSLDLADLVLDPLEPAPAEPRALEASDLLGKLYVLEGSSLGARVLLPRARALGLGGSYGARHLAAQVAALPRWHSFLALLEQVQPLDLDRALQASLATFGAAELAFRRGSHAR